MVSIPPRPLYDAPQIFAREFACFDEDLPHYRRLIEDHQVQIFVEIGPGSGRIFVPLLAPHRFAVGIDLHYPMLEFLRDALTEPPAPPPHGLVQADMATLPLKRNSIDAIIAPYNVVFHFADGVEVEKGFRDWFRVLKPGGLMAYDVSIPRPEVIDSLERGGGHDATIESRGEGIARREEYRLVDGIFNATLFLESPGREAVAVQFQQNLRLREAFLPIAERVGFRPHGVIRFPASGDSMMGDKILYYFKK